MVKHLPAMQETWVQSLGQEDSLEKEMTTHSSTLAWKIPWMEELGAGYCPWGRKESGMTERLHFHFQAWLCPPKQYPYFPIASPTYQKASTSLLSSSISEKSEEARTTTPMAPE